MKDKKCNGCKPCLDSCCCDKLRPYPTGAWYIDGAWRGNGVGFMGFESADCCGRNLLNAFPIGWNWGGSATVTATNPATNCPSPGTVDYVPIPKPDCLDQWLTAHGGFDEVTVGLDGCTPEYSGLSLSDYVLIPRDLLGMESQDPPEYCGDVEQLRVAAGKFACVTIHAVDGATMSCTTCIDWTDGCTPCSSSSGSSSGGSGGSDNSSESSNSGSSSGGSGGDVGGSSSSGSDGSSDSSSGSGSESGSGGGGGGGGSSSDGASGSDSFNAPSSS